MGKRPFPPDRFVVNTTTKNVLSTVPRVIRSTTDANS